MRPLPAAGEVDVEVAGQRQQGGLLGLGVDPEDHHRVGVERGGAAPQDRVAGLEAGAVVDADEQDVLRLAGLGGRRERGTDVDARQGTGLVVGPVDAAGRRQADQRRARC